MPLCKYCEGIDPDTIHDEKKGHEERPRVDYELQPWHLMRLSAQKGCSGCQFFLDVLSQRARKFHDLFRQLGLVPNHVQATDDLLQRDQRIWIQAPFRLITMGIIGIPLPMTFDLDVCLVQGAVSSLSLCKFLGSETKSMRVIAEHDPRFEANPSGPYRPIAHDPSSDSSMDLAASWLAKCASHKDCPSQAAVPLPTRLIEVPQESQKCRLHISAPGEKGHYVTLSHCWGSTVTSCLTKANIARFQRAIDVEDLSRSFQDAIFITRRLGFRFLWIDAICIVQDSVEDWAQEASFMAGIYRNGSLMISALAAPDGQHGILSLRNNLRSHTFGRNKELVCQPQLESEDYHPSSDLDPDTPLHARGWCLQEYIMAPRILHFGKHKLMWECVSRRWAEDSGLADIPSQRPARREARPASMPFMWPSKSDLEDAGQKEKRLAAFYLCISEYTKRKLTRRSDKLPALSGLASACQSPELGAYLAGLWENDLVYGLNWCRRGPPEVDKGSTDGKEYIAPSWSWASIDGHCEVCDTRNVSYWRANRTAESE